MSKQFDLLDKYYSGKATEAEKRSLLKELTHSEVWDADFDRVWDHAFGEMPRQADSRLKKKLRRAARRSDEHKRLMWHRPLQAAAAVLVLASVVAAVYYNYENRLLTRYADMTVEVGSGQKATAYLPDGTKVTLNACSKLSYGKQFDGRQRRVHLTGEAFFKVAKDKSAPFVVEARGVSVRATGTAFDVKAYPDGPGVTTYLSEGSVVVTDRNGRLDLEPGEVAVYSPKDQSLQKMLPSNREMYTAWLNDEMMFDNEPLPEILKQLERNYNIRFESKIKDMNRITFTGTLRNNSLQSTLEALNFASKINYSARNGLIVLTR